MRWGLVEVPRLDEPSGYWVELVVASLGPPQLCEVALCAIPPTRSGIPPEPATLLTLDGDQRAAIVMCTVGPQHQTCFP
jgi:hypothetical protein